MLLWIVCEVSVWAVLGVACQFSCQCVWLRHLERPRSSQRTGLYFGAQKSLIQRHIFQDQMLSMFIKGQSEIIMAYCDLDAQVGRRLGCWLHSRRDCRLPCRRQLPNDDVIEMMPLEPAEPWTAVVGLEA
eukprot:2301631-Amphidinium_carterae.1